MIITIIIAVSIILCYGLMNVPSFGRLPSADRKKQISRLPNYRENALQNLTLTPMQPEGVSFYNVLKSFLLVKHPNKRPNKILESIEPDLSTNLNTKPEIIWFGHSSYLIKLTGLNVLVDPVFSNTPSPFSFLGTKAFAGTDIIKPADLPILDVVVITHDHYDHLDYTTILKIEEKTKFFVCSLGVGSHLESWGIPKGKIIELAWSQSCETETIKFTALPARHFTGRKFKRNQTLWSSFMMQFGSYKIYLGGDSGYDSHFKEIGDEHGPFDLALLECGQYHAYWPFIHMFPEKTVQASIDLKAQYLMPVHWAKFSLAMHPWNEPIMRVVEEALRLNVKITTPMLGQKIVLDEFYPTSQWWKNNS